MVPFESSPGTSGPEEPPPDSFRSGEDSPYERRTPAPLDDNVPVAFGRSLPSAYEPSGASGDLSVMFTAGVPGLAVGLGAAALCAGGSFLLNVLHNVLPVFIFILPIAILALLAASPAAFGLGMGIVVAKSVKEAECRYPAAAGVVAFLWTCAGLALALVGGQLLVETGESFLDDRLLPFIRQMTAYSLTFTYLEEPDPVNVPEWVVYGILGLSALLGVAASYGLADEKVRENPYCERCKKYMKKHVLWKISPVHAFQAMAAFLSLDYKAISRLPFCDFTKNRIDVDLWGCDCRKEYFLELVGHATVPSPDGPPEKKEPVRIISRKLTLDEVNRVRESGVRV